jgi:hypothetical protein
LLGNLLLINKNYIMTVEYEDTAAAIISNNDLLFTNYYYM